MLLTWLFLKTKYRFKKITGVVVCAAGLVLVVFSDVHAGDRAGKWLFTLFVFHITSVSYILYKSTYGHWHKHIVRERERVVVYFFLCIVHQT